MKDYLYVVYALALGVVSFFTGEMVTFIMLGIVLMALNNILKVQKEISRKLDNQNANNEGKETKN